MIGTEQPGNAAGGGPPGAPAEPAVESIPQLIARMQLIGSALPPSDGVACFNRMYLQITELVQQRLRAGFFADPEFMDRLDVVFGNCYLAAVTTTGAAAERPPPPPARAPQAWAASLERRTDPAVCPLQFALAGMNAHINHDLPLAVVDTCLALGTTPDAGSHAADYTRINEVLVAAEAEVRQSFADDLLRVPDRDVPGLQDVVATWNLVRAREAAWTNAQTLWALRHAAPHLAPAYLEGLDRLVGFAGRGLLVPLLAFPPSQS